MTVAAARSRGIAPNNDAARQNLKTISAFVDSWRERLLQGIGIPGDADTVSYILLGMAAEKAPADAATDAMVHFLKRLQQPNGQWRILAHHPPIESNDMQVTAASMHELQLYAPKAGRAVRQSRAARSRLAEQANADDDGGSRLQAAWARMGACGQRRCADDRARIRRAATARWRVGAIAVA